MLAALLLGIALQSPPALTANQMDVADQQVRQGEAAPAGSEAARQLFEGAVENYRKVHATARDAALKVAALEAIARLYDARHLAEPALGEVVLRELSALLPNDLTVLFRLSELQEAQHDLDAAEATLLSARRSQPTEIAPHDMLARFYARRVIESASAVTPPAPAPPPGSPDADGFYRIVDPKLAPRRLDVPQYPDTAQSSGIDGAVLIEVSLDESGRTIDMRVLRSIPILEEAALEAVRNWHYDPALVDGHPVPTRVTVTIAFSLRK